MYVKSIDVIKKINITANFNSRIILDITPKPSVFKTLGLTLDAKGVFKYFEHLTHLSKSHIGMFYIDESFLNLYGVLFNIKLSKFFNNHKDRILFINTNINENLYTEGDLKLWQSNFQIENTLLVSEKNYQKIKTIKHITQIDSQKILALDHKNLYMVSFEETEVISILTNKSKDAICVVDFRNSDMSELLLVKENKKIIILASLEYLLKQKNPNQKLREILAYINYEKPKI